MNSLTSFDQPCFWFHPNQLLLFLLLIACMNGQPYHALQSISVGISIYGIDIDDAN